MADTCSLDTFEMHLSQALVPPAQPLKLPKLGLWLPTLLLDSGWHFELGKAIVDSPSYYWLARPVNGNPKVMHIV